MTNPLPPGALSAGANAAASAAKEVQAAVPGADAFEAIANGAGAVRRWVSDRHNWVRVGWFGAGVALMFVGATMIAGPKVSQPIKDIVK